MGIRNLTSLVRSMMARARGRPQQPLFGGFRRGRSSSRTGIGICLCETNSVAYEYGVYMHKPNSDLKMYYFSIWRRSPR